MNHPTLIVLLLSCFFGSLPGEAQESGETGDGVYLKEVKALRASIQDHFYDADSGYYRVVLDPEQRETKGGYLREYAYLWALCALYQAANEVEKLEADANLMRPLLGIMEHYYDPAPPEPGYSDYIMTLKPGERYYDDNQWIGIAALDAFERTQRQSDLELGRRMYDFMMTGHDAVLGGGIYWKEPSKESKNTCSNGPGILVALKLHQATQEQRYLDTALELFNWTNEKLKTPDKLYYDHVRTEDGSLNKARFSYNTGTMLQSHLYLYECTGDAAYLDEAKAIADRSLEYFYGRGRFRDNYWFNAVLLRAYQHLLKHDSDMKYIRGFKTCLDRALENNRNEQGLFRGRDGVRNLVEQGGMLEMLARFAWLESRYDLGEPGAPESGASQP